jgi:hypothetical protein
MGNSVYESSVLLSAGQRKWKETVVAEKLEALMALGMLNSRMKDSHRLGRASRSQVFADLGGWAIFDASAGTVAWKEQYEPPFLCAGIAPRSTPLYRTRLRLYAS